MASQAGRVAAPPAGPPACDARRRQRTGTVQVSSVRPQSPADVIGNASKHIGSLRADDLLSSTGSRPPQSQLDGSFGVLVCRAALDRELCPDKRVTRAIAAKRSLRLWPVVCVIDEAQNLFAHPGHGKAAGADAEFVIKIGPAFGAVLVIATQRPDKASLPRRVTPSAQAD